MASLKALLVLVVALKVLKLVQIQALLRSSSRFNLTPQQFLYENASHFGFVPSNYFTQVKPTTSLLEMHLTQALTPPRYHQNPTGPPPPQLYQYPMAPPPPSLYQNPTDPPPPQLYENPMWSSPPQLQQSSLWPPPQHPQQGPVGPPPPQFHERVLPYPATLPLGYHSPHFGGTVLPPPNPYATPVSPAVTNIPFYPHPYYPGYFPAPPPEAPQSLPFQQGFDVGFLPTQVRVPGIIKITISGKDAEILCEFPKYLILIQGIYWHHKYSHDPFGTYFDTQNGFGGSGHTIVRAVDQWKSILTIEDFTEDDHGVYRCISSAVLPAEMESPQDLRPKKKYEQASKPIVPTVVPPKADTSASVVHSSVEVSTEEKKERVSRYTKNSRKMRFPQTSEPKVRFSRDTSSKDQVNEETFQYYNNILPAQYPYQDQKVSYSRLTNPYVNLVQNIDHNSIQNERHLHPSYPWGYPGFGFEVPVPIVYPPTSIPQPPPPTTPGYGLNVPYFKPSYSYSTIYQEIKFEPDSSRNFGQHGSNAWRRL